MVYMKNYFDYLYYRITEVYLKWDGDNGINGILIVSLIQNLLLFDIALIIIHIFYSSITIFPYSKIIGVIGVILFLTMIIVNYKKYNKKYQHIKNKWENETKNERALKNVLILISLILPWIPIIYFGIRH